MLKKGINPCFISSYPPRNCGIATFTNDLFTSYQNLHTSAGKVIALNGLVDGDFPPEVIFVVDKNKVADYEKAAECVNAGDFQVVNLQHEFGLFGGPEGRLVIKFLEKLKKPVVTTAHTVMQAPSLGYYTSLIEVIHRSQRVVVISNKAIEILREVYHVPMEKIVMIPHGTPDFPFVQPGIFKKELGLEGRFVLLTFGLLNPGKGIEAALEALPQIVQEHPEALYIILGRTHPEVVKIHGERYRENLQKIVRQLSLENNVLFIDKYVTSHELHNYLNCCDIYLTPYLSQEQISSGTLAYAVALGKAVISTPYWYAQEVLADGRGYLVPFNNPGALAETLRRLLADPEELLKSRRAAYEYGRSMIWPRVAEQYGALFKEVHKEHTLKRIHRISALRKDSLNYLDRYKILNMFQRLTDDTGIIQHSKYGIPDYRYGYSAADAGRALSVVVRASLYEDEPQYHDLAKKYLSFILYVQKEDGSFHNLVSYDRRFLDEVGSDDTFGRVMKGLGAAVAFSSDPNEIVLAQEIFDQAIQNRRHDLPLSTYPKALAYCICGLSYYLKKLPEAQKVKDLLKAGADYLVRLYQLNKKANWDWYEPAVTYANAKVPFALMLAYTILKENKYLATALKTLDFLTNIQYNGSYFDLVGNKNWLVNGSRRAHFDQQPIEIGCLVQAYCEAYRQTKKKGYRELANRAFSWFFGNNCLGVPVYDLKERYPLDALTATGSNANSGAESVISFAMAVICIKEISLNKTIMHRTGLEKTNNM